MKLIGALWIIAFVVLAYVYFARDFTLFTSQFPASATSTVGVFVLTSSAFENDGSIPSVYTCDEKQISPPLSISGAPTGTQSFVLIMEDRDVPKNLKPDGVFLHWTAFNIPASTADIAAGEIVGTRGASGNGVAGYVGPCPPPNYDPAEHRYYFDLYALDTVLNLSERADISALRATMDGHVLAQTTLVGRYIRREK